MRLIDATPFRQQEVRKDEWMFQYGAGLVGQECGAAYVYNENARYVRYKVIEQDGKVVFEKLSERPLTNEELRHFRALVKEIAQAELGTTPLIDREHGRFI